jgi:hypothetical protein
MYGHTTVDLRTLEQEGFVVRVELGVEVIFILISRSLATKSCSLANKIAPKGVLLSQFPSVFRNILSSSTVELFGQLNAEAK